MTSKLDYLAKYTGKPLTETTEKKKKKKKKTSDAKVGGIRIVDDTVSAQPKFKQDDEESEEERPVIVGEIQERNAKSFSLGLNSEGSGWTVVNDNEAPRSKTAHQSNLSPPRRRHDSPDRDLSPPRRGRHDSPPQDLSPPRRRHDSPDLSPPRRGRHDSPPQDLSPPRRRSAVQDLSPPRRSRHDSPQKDLSPPRRRSTAQDLSPPRRNRHDSPPKDLSPPRRRSAVQDLSPPRRKRSSPDLSPPRKGRTTEDSSPPRRTRHDSASPPRKKQDSQSDDSRRLLSGGKAGLLSGKEVSQELQDRKRKMDEKFKSADPEQLGKGAQTVYRDKHGKKLSVNEILATQEGLVADSEEANMEWGTGLVQKNQKESVQDYEDREKAKPFARYVDDEDLNDHFKDQDRWGDPMANLISKKEKKAKKDKKDKKDKKVVVKPAPRWKGAAAPGNRFNILPGWRWDGVDRSNGFEVKILTKEATDVAKAEQAYLWSVEDM